MPEIPFTPAELALEQTGLEFLRLSTGQQQRLCLALDPEAIRFHAKTPGRLNATRRNEMKRLWRRAT